MNERRKKLLLPIGLLALGVVGIAAMVLVRPSPRREQPAAQTPLVRVVEAETRSVALKVHAQGTVMPRTASDLVAEVAGRVEWVSPALVSGGTFEQGEALVRIERSDYEAELESARANVARAQSEASRAGKELARQRKLARNSVASESKIDDAENANRVAQASLREANAQLGRAERDLERTELRAPYTGRVRTEDVDVGQFVSRGNAVARIYAVDFAEVRLPLSDRELAFLEPNAISTLGGTAASHPAVRLSADFAGARHSWLGEIVRSEGEIDPRSRMVHVVARVEDPYGLKRSRAPDAPSAATSDLSSPGELLPPTGASDAGAPAEAAWSSGTEGSSAPLAVGLYVEAEIDGRRLDAAYVLPREVLHDHRGSMGHVWVVDAEHRLQRREVEVLRAQREEVVITAGLRPGERVSVSRLRAPVVGMTVRVAGEVVAERQSADASEIERQRELAAAKR